MEVTRVDFIALPVEDLGRADAFYGETLGLARNPHSSGDRWVEYETGNLTLALSTFGGGLALGVQDVGEARSELEDQGTEFAMDTFDTGVCHGAPFADPDGNRLQLHHRYGPLEPFDVPHQEVLRTDFIGVNVRDRGRASDFYGETVGLKRNPLASDDWPEFEAENVGLVLSTPEQKGGGGYQPEYGVAFRVADVSQAMQRLSAGGVEFEFPEPYDSGVCHMAFFKDPDGNGLMLHHRYAPYRDGEPALIEVERVDFINVPTRDAQRAFDWYHEVLGLPQDSNNAEELRAGQVTVTFWEPEREGIEFKPDVGGFAVRVPDVGAAKAELEAKGVDCVGSGDTGVCNMAVVLDPDGNAVILHRRYAP